VAINVIIQYSIIMLSLAINQSSIARENIQYMKANRRLLINIGNGGVIKWRGVIERKLMAWQ